MPVIPQWIVVNPSDFVKAAEGGAQLGIQRSKIATDANLDTARMQSAERMHGQTIGARAQEAAAELAMARERAKAAEAMKRWETGMELQLAQDRMAQQAEQQAGALSSLDRFRQSQLALRTSQLLQNAKTDEEKAAALKEYREGSLGLQRDRLEYLKTKEANEKANPLLAALNKPAPKKRFSLLNPFTWGGGSSETLAASALPVAPPTNGPPVVVPAQPIFTNAPTASVPPQPIVTNAPASAVAPTSTVLGEGKRFFQKSTGKSGVIRNGVFIPDEESDTVDEGFFPDYSLDEAAFLQ